MKIFQETRVVRTVGLPDSESACILELVAARACESPGRARSDCRGQRV